MKNKKCALQPFLHGETFLFTYEHNFHVHFDSFFQGRENRFHDKNFIFLQELYVFKGYMFELFFSSEPLKFLRVAFFEFFESTK